VIAEQEMITLSSSFTEYMLSQRCVDGLMPCPRSFAPSPKLWSVGDCVGMAIYILLVHPAMVSQTYF
jgi:hypothetical protein